MLSSKTGQNFLFLFLSNMTYFATVPFLLPNGIFFTIKFEFSLNRRNLTAEYEIDFSA